MGPAARAPLLVLGFVALVSALAGGLVRLGLPVPAPASGIAWHGALMASAFFGTLISLERAVALGQPWAYLAPLACGLGGVALLAYLAQPAFVLFIAGAAVLVFASAAIWAQQPALHTGVLVLGAAALLTANVGLLARAPLAACALGWIAFFALTIGGERLELSRYLKRPPAVRLQFLVLVILLLVTPLEPRTLGLVLVLLAAWLLAHDLARVTVRQQGLARYIAVCLLAGYAWLALGGVLMAAQVAYDAALHALFVGFVFSMVFGHAPVILPAVLRVKLPYHPALYAPLALLHASLLARVLFPAPLGAWGNAAAIALFIATAATLALRRPPDAFSRRA